MCALARTDDVWFYMLRVFDGENGNGCGSDGGGVRVTAINHLFGSSPWPTPMTSLPPPPSARYIYTYIHAIVRP